MRQYKQLTAAEDEDSMFTAGKVRVCFLLKDAGWRRERRGAPKQQATGYDRS